MHSASVHRQVFTGILTLIILLAAEQHTPCCCAKVTLLLRKGNLTAAQATSAGIDSFGRSVDNSLHAADIGLPSAVGSAMRVGLLDTECDSFSAKITFCHDFGTSLWLREL